MTEPSNPPTRPNPNGLRPSLGDSPLFWACLFGGMALLILALMGPRIDKRQAQIENKYQARERAAEYRANRSGQAEKTEPPAEEEAAGEFSTPGDLMVSLRPLAIFFAAVLLLAAVAMGWLRLRQSGRESDVEDRQRVP